MTQTVTAKPGFQRKPIPLPFRLVVSALVYGVLTPVIRSLELFGGSDRFLRTMGKRERRTNNAFQHYIATEHDVFVAVYM
ncbi:MAG: hypothetical protein ACRD5L_10725, partial [Bryobacteraceae bacterium]